MDLKISLIIIVVGILAILVALLCSCAGGKSKSGSGENFNPSTISTLSPYYVFVAEEAELTPLQKP